MSLTNILITIIGTILLVVFWIYRFITPKAKDSKISIPFIFFFNLICFFTVYWVPIIFSKITDIIPCVFAKLVVLIIEAFSINIFFSLLNGLLVKQTKTDIETNVKNRIYLLTVIYSFTILFAFLIKTYLKCDNYTFDDMDDFLKYLIAPLTIIIGNLLPLKSSYSKEGMRVEIEKNWKEEYSLKKVDREIIFYSMTISHITNLFFGSFFIIEKIEYGIDHLCGPVLVAVVLSGGVMFVLHLIDRRK